jgi:hypothetical protein
MYTTIKSTVETNLLHEPEIDLHSFLAKTI